jgi:two-component system cell cycle response regulator DivK
MTNHAIATSARHGTDLRPPRTRCAEYSPEPPVDTMASQLVVLLVQAERDDRDMYAEFFRHQGWLPIPASTVGDALSLAPIADIVIAGILLSDHMDGIEFIVQLKANERTKSIPVIVLTTCAWKAERDRAESVGSDMFLAKPCLPDDLKRAVRRVLSRRRVPKPNSRMYRLHPRLVTVAHHRV